MKLYSLNAQMSSRLTKASLAAAIRPKCDHRAKVDRIFGDGGKLEYPEKKPRNTGENEAYNSRSSVIACAADGQPAAKHLKCGRGEGRKESEVGFHR
jgi:hypothetical protein